MTPLEELQAAHKRLSELRDGTATWTTRYRGAMRGYGVESDRRVMWVATEIEEEHDADLIVTLHRTIDAQLELLEDRCLDDVSYQVQGDKWPALQKVRTVDRSVLALARAINGVTA